MQVDHPHFDISFGCFVFGLRSLAFQKITLGFGLSFFIGGVWTVRSCGYVAFCYSLLLDYRLPRHFFQFRIVQAHFTNRAGCKNIVKNAFVQLVLHKNGYPIPSKPLPIQVIPHRLYSFSYSLSYKRYRLSHTVTRRNKRPNRGQRKSNYRL